MPNPSMPISGVARPQGGQPAAVLSTPLDTPRHTPMFESTFLSLLKKIIETKNSFGPFFLDSQFSTLTQNVSIIGMILESVP
jgi:hypothetical protein